MSHPTPRGRLPSVGSLSIATVVLLLITATVTLGLPHWQKLRLLSRVEQAGGRVRSEYGGPERFRGRSAGEHREFFMRVTEVRADGVDDAFLSLAAVQPELRVLSVSSRDISATGLAELGTARRVRILDLINSGLSDEDIRPLAGIDDLLELRLPHNAVQGSGFQDFPEQSQLQHLDLTWCPVTDEGLRYIARLPMLQSLDLSGSAVTDRGLIHLELHPELTTLNLYGTSVGDGGVYSLARIPRLSQVVLMDTRVTDAGRRRLLELRPDCRIENQTPMPTGF